MGGARNLRDHALMRAATGFRDRLAAHHRADDRFVDDLLLKRQFAARHELRHAPRRARTGRRAIHLPIREDAAIGLCRAGMARGSVDDRAIDVVDLGDIRVLHAEGAVCRRLHLRPETDEPLHLVLADREAMRHAARIEIERAAEGDVAGHAAEARGFHRHIPVKQETRHVEEAHAGDAAPVPPHEGLDEAAGRVDPYARLRRFRQHPAELHRSRGERDDAMAAMVGITLVVDEHHPEIRPLADGVAEDAAIHVGVPARLEHDGLPEVIGIRLEPGAAIDDAGARRAGEAAGDNAERLAAGMHFHGGDDLLHRFLMPCRPVRAGAGVSRHRPRHPRDPAANAAGRRRPPPPCAHRRRR